MDALSLRARAAQSGGLSSKFRDLSGSAFRLVIERPAYWEYLLFAKVLGSGLKELSDLKRDWQYCVAMGDGPILSRVELVQWFQGKNSEALRMMSNISVIIDRALPVAFGPPGVSGDAEAILHAAGSLGSMIELGQLD